MGGSPDNAHFATDDGPPNDTSHAQRWSSPDPHHEWEEFNNACDEDFDQELDEDFDDELEVGSLYRWAQIIADVWKQEKTRRNPGDSESEEA